MEAPTNPTLPATPGEPGSAETDAVPPAETVRTAAPSGRKRSASDWAPKFLKSLSTTGIIGESARLAGVHRSTVYDRRDSDPEFADLMAAAIEDAVDRLEAVAWKRAKKKSDKLLQYLLTRRRYPMRLQHEGGVAVRLSLQDAIAADKELESWEREYHGKDATAESPAGPAASGGAEVPS